MKTLTVCIVALLVVCATGTELSEEFTWSRISFAWPGSGHGGYSHHRFKRDTSRSSIIYEDPNLVNSGWNDGIDYDYVNNVPVGANVWKNKLFITIPRRKIGIPSTLNYVPLNAPQRHNVPLIPYPNWDMNIYPDPKNSGDNFVSVYRIGIDPCDRLWFVDTGLVEVLGNMSRIRPTTIVIINLNTDKVIHTYKIPVDQLRAKIGLASITVDVTEDTCDDAYAYLPDLSGFGLIVYSFKDNRSWRLSHNYFNVEPGGADFLVSGHRYQWQDGIFSVELSRPKSNGYRDLYFHSMAGTRMYKVSTEILKNRNLSTRPGYENFFEIVGDRGKGSQSSSAFIHQPSNIMFLGVVNQNALGCWNIHKPLSTISLVYKDDGRMLYPSDVKVYKDKVYVLTNNMPRFVYGKFNYDQVNFRVWSNNVYDAVAGTNCAEDRVMGRTLSGTYSGNYAPAKTNAGKSRKPNKG